MHLKKLHEAAQWKRLTETDFRIKVTSLLMDQQDLIENLGNIVTKLEDEILTIKKQIGINSLQTARLNKTVRSTPKVEDASPTRTQQKRDNRPIS